VQLAERAGENTLAGGRLAARERPRAVAVVREAAAEQLLSSARDDHAEPFLDTYCRALVADRDRRAREQTGAQTTTVDEPAQERMPGHLFEVTARLAELGSRCAERHRSRTSARRAGSD
jgi:hypothetical protein